MASYWSGFPSRSAPVWLEAKSAAPAPVLLFSEPCSELGPCWALGTQNGGRPGWGPGRRERGMEAAGEVWAQGGVKGEEQRVGCP